MASIPDEETEVVVCSKREKGPSPEPRLIINYVSEIGGLFDNISQFFSNLLRSETSFDIDNAFGNSKKNLIAKIIAGLSNHPAFVEKFEELRRRNVDVNFRPVTRPDQIPSWADGQTTINLDGSITIFIRIGNPDPFDSRYFATPVVHELIHAFADAAFDARLDAVGSRWAADITNDLLRGLDLTSLESTVEPFAAVILPSDQHGDVTGSVGGSILVGSNRGNSFFPKYDGNMIFTQSGDDRIVVSENGHFNYLISGGGTDTIELPSVFYLDDISVLSSNDSSIYTLLVFKEPKISIDVKYSSLQNISILHRGQLIPLISFNIKNSALPESHSAHIDYFGGFYGGFIGSAAVSDLNGVKLYYRLGEVFGAYAAEDWTVDRFSGVISANFVKPDLGGSEFTSLSVVVSNGASNSINYVTVRWAYSNEYEPTL